jgi:predicted ATPase
VELANFNLRHARGPDDRRGIGAGRFAGEGRRWRFSASGGRTLLDDALQIVERTGECWFAAELNKQKGQLLLREGHSEAADELFRKALSIAVDQEAKLWELRAAANLAQLRRDQDRRTEARYVLAPVYNWFTEGFDTPDLKEAKALLDELDE